MERAADPHRVVGMLLAAIALCGMLTGAAPTPTPGGETIKVCVVKGAEDNGGRPDTLADIARRTLGDPGRAQEIFELNVGRRQRDGGALTDPARLTPGWILRLPADARGPDVLLARLPTDDAVQDPDAGERRYRLVLLAVAVVAALAGLTALVLARRPVSRFAGRTGRAVIAPFVEPRRRARIRTARERVGERMDGDRETRTAARRAVDELMTSARPGHPIRVYSVVVAPSVMTARVAASTPPPSPWTAENANRWSRPRPVGPTAADAGHGAPRLVRVGSADDATVLVDLTHLDGILAVTGDHDVARDLLTLLARELLDDATGAATLTVVDPAGLIDIPSRAARVPSLDVLRAGRRAVPAAASQGVVTAAARPRPDTPVIVVPAPLPAADTAALVELCTPHGGWTALVVGDVPTAHWRWTADADGTADLGVLDRRVTVPIFA